MILFVGGMIFVLVISPIISEITEVICSWLEVLKTIAAVKITGMSKGLNLEEMGGACAIGFHAPNGEELYYDEDE